MSRHDVRALLVRFVNLVHLDVSLLYHNLAIGQSKSLRRCGFLSRDWLFFAFFIIVFILNGIYAKRSFLRNTDTLNDLIRFLVVNWLHNVHLRRDLDCVPSSTDRLLDSLIILIYVCAYFFGFGSLIFEHTLVNFGHHLGLIDTIVAANVARATLHSHSDLVRNVALLHDDHLCCLVLAGGGIR